MLALYPFTMKYIQVAKIHFETQLAYRAKVVIYALTDMVEFVFFPLVWLAVYGARDSIAGYTRADIVSYYIVLAMVSLAASTYAANMIRNDIMEGRLSNYFVKPVNYFADRLISESTWKIINAFFAVLLVAAASIFLPQYVTLPPTVGKWLLFLSAIAVSFILSFLIQCVIGLGAFWLGEAGALQNFASLMRWVFAGEIAPLTFYPQILQTVASWLPFQYLSYMPAQIFLNRVDAASAVRQFGAAVIWISALSLTALFMWRRGIKKYEGAGI